MVYVSRNLSCKDLIDANDIDEIYAIRYLPYRC